MASKLSAIAKQSAYAAGALLPLAEWVRPSSGPSMHCLLFHKFFSQSESKAVTIDRLHRQLEWLRTNYKPVSLREFVDRVSNSDIQDRMVLVTTDDAFIDLIDVIDVFKAHEVPICAFVCVGWTASGSKSTDRYILARAASGIQWYEGDAFEFPINGQTLRIAPSERPAAIDALISLPSSCWQELETLCLDIESRSTGARRICTWDELRALRDQGVEIGSHSVTHIRMASASPKRLEFEVGFSRELCQAALGTCDVFAYPYGMAETCNEQTHAAVNQAGYQASFLTHSDYITNTTDKFSLPRIPMPDGPISMMEFTSKARGTGIALRQAAALVR